jgi:3-dehydroquinate synthase
VSKIVKIKINRPASSYRISVGSGTLASAGTWAQNALKKGGGKIVVVSNPTVFKLYGEQCESSLRQAGFTVSTFLMKDGEVHKSLRTAESALKALSESGLTRTDAVVALGGGVVGDLAGFAAAMYLRGVAFMQIPTTLLAMIDSSVGGKTGVNSAFGKNLIGAFHQPNGVLIDVSTLATLPPREITAGFCEMIKHGAIGGKPLLTRTDALLTKYPIHELPTHLENRNFRSEISNLIASNVEFKAEIVAGDELELASKTDARSRKVLNFGHTLAHALEKVTGYRYFKHGEAVGYGILFAAELSKTLALCDEKVVNLLYDVVHRVGTLPSLAGIDATEVIEAFRFDKKNISGSLQMVLLKGLGRPVIVSQRDIPTKAFHTNLKNFLQKRPDA